MRIALRIAPGRARRWMVDLRDGLRAQGHRVEIAVGAPCPIARDVAALFSLEKLLVDRGRPGRGDLVTLEAPAAAPGVDLTLDFTDDPPPAGPHLRATFDGAAGEDALLAALLGGRPPVARLIDGAGATVVEIRAALEAARGLAGGIEAVGSRLVMAILACLADRSPRLLPHDDAAPAPRRGALAAAGASLTRLARDAIARRLAFAPHWRIGWRIVDDGDVLDRLSLEGPRWTVLADPGDHFYADPFPLEHAGRRLLFFEDLDHRLGKGIISVVEFGADGAPGPARPIIEEPHHLSYPHVFAHAGELWMVPESSVAQEIVLWRCARLPDRWERAGTLVSGVEAADATLFEQAGQWWMTAVVRPGWGGYSDALAIWRAPALFGPWTPHAANPALIDARAARPAGAVVKRGGRLIRPVQDCESLYGAALRFYEITRLDADGFEQRLLAHLEPGTPRWPGTRLHTWNRAGSLEAIDGDAFNPRSAPWRAAALRRQTPR